MDLSFGLWAAVPWSKAGLRDPVFAIGTGITPPGQEQAVRLVPTPSVAPDGAVWLLALRGGAALRVRAAGVDAVPLTAAGADSITAIAPAPNEGVVVLGRKGRENVLALLQRNGALAWRRVGPLDYTRSEVAALRGDFDQVLTDLDGAVYLSATKQRGEVARLDLTTGATPVAVDLGEYRARVWIHQGRVYRVMYTDGARRWVARDLKTGQEHAVAAALDLQEALALPCCPLPDGGALLREDGTLIFMDADGHAAQRLALAGVVRSGTEVVTAMAGEKDLVLSRWARGQRLGTQRVSGLPEGAQLVAVDPHGSRFLVPGSDSQRRLIRVDAQGHHREEEVSALRQHFSPEGGRVNLASPAVAADGTVFLAGADGEGVFLVQLLRGR